MDGEKKYLKDLEEIIQRGTDWDEMIYADRLKLVNICKAYRNNLDKYVRFVYTLADISEEQLLKEEEFRVK